MIGLLDLIYSRFHKTLPKSSLQKHLLSVRFYEMGVTHQLQIDIQVLSYSIFFSHLIYPIQSLCGLCEEFLALPWNKMDYIQRKKINAYLQILSVVYKYKINYYILLKDHL